MILIPIIALVIGALLGIVLSNAFFPVPPKLAAYLAVACVAGLDSICGGIRAGLEGKFHNDIFVTGFLSNVLIASFLAWLGDQIGINLFLAAAIVLGARIFTNLSLIRRYGMTRWQEARERRRRQQSREA
ncbi:MAG: small basic family protein [Fimbriimonadaceae bacterium]